MTCIRADQADLQTQLQKGENLFTGTYDPSHEDIHRFTCLLIDRLKKAGFVLRFDRLNYQYKDVCIQYYSRKLDIIVSFDTHGITPQIECTRCYLSAYRPVKIPVCYQSITDHRLLDDTIILIESLFPERL